MQSFTVFLHCSRSLYAHISFPSYNPLCSWFFYAKYCYYRYPAALILCVTCSRVAHRPEEYIFFLFSSDIRCAAERCFALYSYVVYSPKALLFVWEALHFEQAL